MEQIKFKKTDPAILKQRKSAYAAKYYKEHREVCMKQAAIYYTDNGDQQAAKMTIYQRKRAAELNELRTLFTEIREKLKS